jgi:hypothetical protein
LNTSLVIIAGLAGTFTMTACAELIFILIKRPYHIVGTLGRMFEFRKPTPEKPRLAYYLLATMLHYGIGVGFCYLYYWALFNGLLNFTVTHAILYGLIIGTLGIIGWRIFFAVHPDPPQYSLPVYLFVIWLGHIVLAVTMFQVFLLVDLAEEMGSSPNLRWINSYGRYATLLIPI